MTEIFHITHVDEALLDAERQGALKLIEAQVPAEYVYEVGSTAIAGMLGKNDLDFLVRVPEAHFKETRDALDRAFERNPKQMSNAGYQGYRIHSELDVAIQLTVADGPYDTFLLFLSQLRGSETLRSQYNALKRAHDGRAMSEYRQAKATFIASVLND